MVEGFVFVWAPSDESELKIQPLFISRIENSQGKSKHLLTSLIYLLHVFVGYLWYKQTQTFQ